MRDNIRVTIRENDFHKSNWWLVDENNQKVCKVDRISSIDMEKSEYDEILNIVTQYPSGSARYVDDNEIAYDGYGPGYHYFPDRE